MIPKHPVSHKPAVPEAAPKAVEEVGYAQINYLKQTAKEAPWVAAVELFPTLEEANARAESLKASGERCIKVTSQAW